MRPFLLLLFLLLASTSTLEAQVPPRVALEAGADTLSAAAYYAHGIERLERNPRDAANAFYWASRLEPGWAEPYYARRTALLLANRQRLPEYLEGNRRARNVSDFQMADSLYRHALTLDPFMYRDQDRVLFKVYTDEVSRQIEMSAGIGRVDRALLEYEISNYLMRNPNTRAWMAYSDGDFPTAISGYQTALSRARGEQPGIRAELARTYWVMGEYESAKTEMNEAIVALRARDANELVSVYNSKAMLEHSLASIHHALGEMELAREAWARALEEDLTYFPAHVRLAGVAMELGDTPTALMHLDFATQVREDDAMVRHMYGLVLLEAGHMREALEQLQAAILHEPLYAKSYYLAGFALDALERWEEAIPQYQAFLERATRDDPAREWSENRLALLLEAFGTDG